MNFLRWRTDKELRTIVSNTELDMDIRVRAQSELFRRTLPGCSMPGCSHSATEQWATVPVCKGCKSELWQEQIDFYSFQIVPAERVMMYKLYPFTPWGRKRVG